jgi:hypothetical protein
VIADKDIETVKASDDRGCRPRLRALHLVAARWSTTKATSSA